jgi:hypothetical protein
LIHALRDVLLQPSLLPCRIVAECLSALDLDDDSESSDEDQPIADFS